LAIPLHADADDNLDMMQQPSPLLKHPAILPPLTSSNAPPQREPVNLAAIN